MKRSVFAIVTLALVAGLASRYSTIAGQSNGSGSRNSSDWAAYGHDPGGQRFSPLTQLTPSNVNGLQVAWAYHMRPAPVEQPGPATAGQGRGGGRGASGFSSSETTPIVVDGLMYLTTPYGRVVALDSSSGHEVWNFKVPADDPSTRGVAYWAGDGDTPAQVVFGTGRGRLFSLNAKTGEPNPKFGDGGSVDLNTPEILQDLAGSNGLSSPPAIYRNLIITGGRTQENPPLGPAGDVRAWDAHNGKLVWTFHSIPRPGEKYHETWVGEGWKNRSGVNVWGFITVDVERGIVYMPFGAPSVDQYGGDRRRQSLQQQHRGRRRQYGQVSVALSSRPSRLVGRRSVGSAGLDRRQ